MPTRHLGSAVEFALVSLVIEREGVGESGVSVEIRADAKEAFDRDSSQRLLERETVLPGDVLESIACKTGGLVDRFGKRFGVCLLYTSPSPRD